MSEPRAYRLLYSQGTAAVLVLLSGSVLAMSQTHVIRDWLAVLHPTWGPFWLWANAAGFELVVLAVGLVLALTGHQSLWAMEVFLIAVSCLAAGDSMPAGEPLRRTVLASLMPLQYLAAVLAGHHLATPPKRTRSKDTRQDNLGPAIETMPAAPRRSGAAKQDTRAAITPALYERLSREHVPAGTPATRADAIIADIVGTSTKTAQRARLAGTNAL